MKVSENTKERLFEVLMLVTGFIGLLILFTVLFAGPRFIINRLIEFFS